MIVSDTSSLNYLVWIEQINLLAKLYGRVLIPQSVYRELSAPEAPAPVRTWIGSPPAWLEVSSVSLEPEDGLQSLYSGERDAITLALYAQAEALLIDERRGREEAENRQIRVRSCQEITFRLYSTAGQASSGTRQPNRKVIFCQVLIGTLGILAAAHESGLLDLAQALSRLRQTTFHVSPRLLAALLRKYQISAKEEQ
jgi:predicted nucleic acid-binding protein